MSDSVLILLQPMELAPFSQCHTVVNYTVFVPQVRNSPESVLPVT